MGILSVLAAVSYACFGRDLTGPNVIPASIDIVSGQGQSGKVGEELSQPLVARVLNSVGQPVAGQIVNFRIIKGSGSVFAGAAITNADGLARERWTIGTSVADSQVVEARAVEASTGAGLVFARFVATALAGPASIAEKIGGDAQIAIAGAALPESLLVRFSDVYGNPVSGASVEWDVEAGSGTLSISSGLTNASGYASTKWTLGSDTGAQTVRAVVTADLSALFTAYASPNLPLYAVKFAGDGQTATPGSAVAVRPAVRVFDANGALKAGVAVTFAVTGGSGSVTGAEAVSDGAGIATVGSWVLGSLSGINTLAATPANGGSATFTATAAQASSDITVSITDPVAGPVGDTVLNRVSVNSRFQLSSVRVALAGRTATLSPSTQGIWQGTLSLVGTPRDTMTLVATATDVNAGVAQAVRALIHDRKPRVVVTQPLNNSVLRGTVEIDVGCDDDDSSGCTVWVWLTNGGPSAIVGEGPVLAGPSPSPLRTSISLSQPEGARVILGIRARDSRDQVTSVLRTVWVESSPRLQLIGSVDGTLLDGSTSRLLWSASSATTTTVGIRHLPSGASDTIATGLEGFDAVARGFLTPTGAAFTESRSNGPYALLYLWRNGTLTSKELNSISSPAASGPYVIFSNGPLYRTDVTNGTDILIAADAGNTGNSVSENGDVAYMNSSFDIGLYRGGINTAVTADPDDVRYNSYPLTDGVNVVFLRRAPCCGLAQLEIWLYDGTSLTALAPERGYDVSPHWDYEVNGGWTAFTKADASSIAQVWTRSPTGVLRAVSAFGSKSTIRGLAPDGSVIFDNGSDRYLAGPASTPARIGTSLGKVVWRDGQFVVLIGNSALLVTP